MTIQNDFLFSRLCFVLGVTDLSEFYVPALGDHENVFSNLTTGAADGQDNSCDVDRQSTLLLAVSLSLSADSVELSDCR